MQLMIEDGLCSQMIGFCTRKKKGRKNCWANDFSCIYGFVLFYELHIEILLIFFLGLVPWFKALSNYGCVSLSRNP